MDGGCWGMGRYAVCRNRAELTRPPLYIPMLANRPASHPPCRPVNSRASFRRAGAGAARLLLSACAALCVASTSAPAQSSDSARKPRAAAKTGAKSTKKSTPASPTKPPPKWPVVAPDPLPGSILPQKRIVAFYGNPLSKRMGILGELPPQDMLARLDREVAAWNAADPTHPVPPALHLIADVAQGDAGTSGKYRTRMDSALIEKVYGWAKSKNALLFLDVQVGQGTLQEELPRLIPFLSRPDVHLGIDPEFSMHYSHEGMTPGS